MLSTQYRLLAVNSGISMALKMPSPTLKKDCAAILENMKVGTTTSS